MDRSKTLLELRHRDEYLPASPAGTRALMNLIGDKPSGKRGPGKERAPGPKKLLLITHEMTDVLKMTGVDNSTLASRLCDFWDDNQHVYPITLSFAKKVGTLMAELPDDAVPSYRFYM